MTHHFSNKAEEDHPNHGGTSRRRDQKSVRCRKCMLGENYGL